jgi:hypothetical protein
MARGKDHCPRLLHGDEQRLANLESPRRKTASPKDAQAVCRIESLSSLGTNQTKRHTD